MKSEAICASLHLVPLITGAVRDDRAFSRTDGPIARTVRCFQRLSDIGILSWVSRRLSHCRSSRTCRKQNADPFLALVPFDQVAMLAVGIEIRN